MKERRIGKAYYYADVLFGVDVILDTDQPLNRDHFLTKNYFKSREAACEYLDVLKIKFELLDFAEKHNDKAIDWNDEGQAKYVPYYSKYEKTLEFHPYLMDKCAAELIAFTSEEVADAAVEAIGKDRFIKYMEYDW